MSVNGPLPSHGGQPLVALRSKELHDEPAISYVTDKSSALTLVNSDGCRGIRNSQEQNSFWLRRVDLNH
jgi:hypothetical protein